VYSRVSYEDWEAPQGHYRVYSRVSYEDWEASQGHYPDDFGAIIMAPWVIITTTKNKEISQPFKSKMDSFIVE
jgi:hypothetical protein